MEIIVAKNSGLCYGVRRALNIVKKTREKREGAVFTLGALIHNPQIIADLRKKGIHSIDDFEKLNGGTVIIRSHGVSPAVYSLLAKKKIEVIDATCPIVKKIQRLVERLAKGKVEIVIVGNKEHPEIKGLIGYSHAKGIIVENEDQARSLAQRKKRAVLAQSTQDIYLFQKIVAALIEKTEQLMVYNTICHFTQTRQKSTSELASRVDTLLIVGGRSSSNTNKLYQISKRILPNTYFIESAKQITPRMIKGARRIGLSGGASTPPEAIDEAVSKIKASLRNQYHRENIAQCQR